MNKETYQKAFRIVRSGGVKLIESTPSILIFNVRQESGPWIEVWRDLDPGGFFIWSCNAVDKNKKWGCTMYAGDRTQAFCSHCKAVEFWLEGVEISGKVPSSVPEESE